MPSRRVALVGCNRQGPPIAIKGVKEPLLRVRGASDGMRIAIVLLDENSKLRDSHEFIGNGDFAISESVWAQVSCTTPSRSLICEVISKQVA